MSVLWAYGGAQVEAPNQDIIASVPVIDNMDIEGIYVKQPKITVSPEPPDQPIEGDIWIDTNVT